jgi:predicted DNA-binding protein
VRQVRLPEQMNAELSELAAAEGRRASEIIREALAAYLSTHRAS